MPRSGRLRLTSTPEPATIGPLLRDLGFVGCEDDPVACRASFDHAGRPRRIIANYPGGWRCDVRLHKSGSYSMSQSISISVRAGQVAPR